MRDRGKTEGRVARVLFLTLTKQWFDAIAQGKKKEEYREIKPYFAQRLLAGDGKPREYDEIHFRNGYAPKAPYMRVRWNGLRYRSMSGNKVFAILLGRILKIKNWKGASLGARRS